MGVKLNLKMVAKNHVADPEIGFLTKSISKPYDRATTMSPAWELRKIKPFPMAPVLPSGLHSEFVL